jgi:hypothetical protein
MLSELLLTLFFFYLVGLTWGYVAGSYTTRHTSCLQYISFITCVIPHTPKQIQIVRPMPHTPVDIQLIITQETPSTPSGQWTPSTSQEPEEALPDHQSYVIQMDSPLIQWN